MPPRSHPLPPDLEGATFTTKEALEQQVSRKRLRSRDLDARVHGVRAPVGSNDDLWQRCRSFAARLDETAFFSHSTAARLLGAPLPRRLATLQRIHVSVEAPRRAPHARGLLGHSRRLAPADVLTLGGLLISSPARLWCEMAGALSLHELVALTDHLIHRERRLTDREHLAARREFGDRISRHHHLIAALELCSERSESPPETYLRLACLDAGLPPASANHEIVDTETGRSYRLDLAWPELRFAIEYQGDGHRSKEQWRRDMTRRERLRVAGWTILELNADDLKDQAALVALIRAGMARRG